MRISDWSSDVCSSDLLQGAPLVASVLDRDVLAARLPGHQPADLDALCTSGEVVWVGAGAIGSTDGRIRLAFRDQAALLLPAAGDDGFEPEPIQIGSASCRERVCQNV